MKKDTFKTKVQFFMETGNGTDNETPFAFFPDENYYHQDTETKTSYAHVGQHSSCSIGYTKDKRKASESEYKNLKQELEGLGYNLQVLK